MKNSYISFNAVPTCVKAENIGVQTTIPSINIQDDSGILPYGLSKPEKSDLYTNDIDNIVSGKADASTLYSN